jgi:UPF0755 protein
MKRYYADRSSRSGRLRRVYFVLVVLAILLGLAAVAVRHVYNNDLAPVSNVTKTTLFTIKSGESTTEIADALKSAGLIRSSSIFEWYVSSKNVRADLQAGTYSLSPSMSVQDEVYDFTNGKVAANLVTILPGQRIDQIEAAFVKDGYSQADVTAAFNASLYAGNPALADNPTNVTSLEGFLYPDSFEKDENTQPQVIIQESLNEMSQHLTPSIKAAFAHEGLSVYQGVTLASIVEQEVSKDSDRAQVAQVFLSRLKQNMPLGSDVTAFYGAVMAGQQPSTTYDTPYNTLIHTGLPPGPISNVSESSLYAVAHPANTSWLYFVTGDNGTTYFSTNLQQHEAYTQEYCHKLCSGTQ